jgi:hypothetical protein
MLTILKLLRAAKTAPLPPRHRSVPADAPADDERPLGCGWFDSSHELQAGLLVTEHRSADAVAGGMAVVDWLDLQLRGWRAPVACSAV